ncbi:FG-GAP-like repeat-containing protein [Nocardioides sp. YIM 152588]|uniref:FG-GAP-like repeat-containing protein n=1 Tax=Nocardioides sp. YIM 152588 TaxID=3158259 RepID=UPI0032E4A3D6
MSFLVPDAARRSRFVIICQHLLALAVILAVLTPAARIVTMDVRPFPAGESTPSRADKGEVAYLRAATVPTKVAAAPVDPVVDEYSLTAPKGARIAPGALRAEVRRTKAGGTEILTDALPVEGYGAVGVTWAHGTEVGDDAIGLKARTRTGGRWSGWTTIEYHDEHGPDPDSLEARNARPGSDPLLIGDVDRVQVRINTEDAAPSDMKLAVIDPGADRSMARETPEIDTAELDAARTAPRSDVTDPATDPEAGTPEDPADGDDTTDGTDTADGTDEEGDLTLSAAASTPKPKIFSRAQWGADERMRDRPSLHYYEVHAGFVHHTVNANDYTKAQVPSIIRGIYAYHTRSRGWSDIGYNFLVDRFGRIWEGRYGGVDRPVVGAHTLGYNDDAFAMSAIGNYEVTKPSAATVRAYGALFAWKLSLHGVDASSTKQYVTSRNFQAINGHRDADSTACPGKYLYAKLGRIRTLAAKNQVGWSGRELESDLAATELPDLVVRRASDGRGVVVPLRYNKKRGQVVARSKVIDTGLDLSGAAGLFRAGDWDRDGFGDLLVRRKGERESLYLYRGLGEGQFDPKAIKISSGFRGVRLIAAVGDTTGDGWPDLMGQPKGGSMMIYPGRGLDGLRAGYVAHSAVRGKRNIAIGRWDADGAPDSLVRSGPDLTVWTGNGPGGWTVSRSLGAVLGGYDWTVGVSSVDDDGHADLLVRSRSTKELWLLPTTSKGVGSRVLLGDMSDYDLAG